MKKFLTIAALVLIAGPVVIDPVFAADQSVIHCKTSEPVADAGFFFSASTRTRTANLSEETFAGMRSVAKGMKCQILPTVPRPDSIGNYLLCKDENGNSGLIVRAYAGGIANLHFAKVLKLVRDSNGELVEEEVQFGDLNCKN